MRLAARAPLRELRLVMATLSREEGHREVWSDRIARSEAANWCIGLFTVSVAAPGRGNGQIVGAMPCQPLDVRAALPQSASQSVTAPQMTSRSYTRVVAG
jgi:hypothetical protein